jgi:hypothetical protein
MSVRGLLTGIALAFRTYPAITLMLVNVGVLLAAHLGYHVSATELTTIAIAASGFVGIIVHNAVTPNVRVPVVPDFPVTQPTKES